MLGFLSCGQLLPRLLLAFVIFNLAGMPIPAVLGDNRADSSPLSIRKT